MWYAISSVMVLVGIVSVVFKGIEYGIDFRGGTELVIGFSSKVAVSDIRVALDKVGLGKSREKERRSATRSS
jgi:preprotein translocase subunit SecF